MKKVNLYALSLILVFGLTGCDNSDNSDNSGDGGETVTSISIQNKSISYDTYGRVVKEDLGNGQYIEYTYDDNGNLISQNSVN